MSKVPKITVLQFRNDILDNFDPLYLNRRPSHNQNIQNNKSLLSQQLDVLDCQEIRFLV